MSALRKINSAFISVWNKDSLGQIAGSLHKLGIKIYSTGGTAEHINNSGIPVISVEEVTGYPSILGGRVKTLHPKIFGGILARRDKSTDAAELERYSIPQFDLIVVDLYPFGETVTSAASHEEIIEKIDIGGISLIRAAAKNFNDVVVIPSTDHYQQLLTILDTGKGKTTLEQRQSLAGEAFGVTARYDKEINEWFAGESDGFSLSYNNRRKMRYGENPHQDASYYGSLPFEQLHGKELSYNNLLDIDAAVGLISEFRDPTFAILKHNNACGIASRSSLREAWAGALAGDPVSAFGGVLITNSTVDDETAEDINKLFFEVIVAPGYKDKALEILKTKKNRIILVQNSYEQPEKLVRSVTGGILVQDRDSKTETAADMKVVTKTDPTPEEIADMIFANKVVKHSRSNAIVLAKNLRMVGSGAGQTSRIDALKQAIEKARSAGFDLEGAVMASDAFFPFADSVEIAQKAGIKAVIQPGGSVRDQESVEFCDNTGMVMVFTGTRHFRH